MKKKIIMITLSLAIIFSTSVVSFAADNDGPCAVAWPPIEKIMFK